MYAMPAFNYKWKYEIHVVDIVIYVDYNTQFKVSHFLFFFYSTAIDSSLNLLFSDILIAVFVMVCLSFLTKGCQFIHLFPTYHQLDV